MPAYLVKGVNYSLLVGAIHLINTRGEFCQCVHIESCIFTG